MLPIRYIYYYESNSKISVNLVAHARHKRGKIFTFNFYFSKMGELFLSVQEEKIFFLQILLLTMLKNKFCFRFMKPLKKLKKTFGLAHFG